MSTCNICYPFLVDNSKVFSCETGNTLGNSVFLRKFVSSGVLSCETRYSFCFVNSAAISRKLYNILKFGCGQSDN